MKQWIGFFLCLFIIFSSCKKETSIEGSNIQSDSLLVRKVTNFGSDSDSYDYGYDNARRLISQHYTATSQGSAYNEQITLRRDTKEIIKQVILKSDSLKAANLDSLVYNVKYDASKSLYTAKVAALTIFGFSVKDSTAYGINTLGRIIRAEEFFDDGSSGGYSELQKKEFTYDSDGNIINIKTFNFNNTTGVYILAEEEDYEYDTKTNPLSLGIDAFFVDDPVLFSNHNVTKETFTSYYTPSQNSLITYIYNYNTLGKPDFGNGTYKNGGTAPITFYYH